MLFRVRHNSLMKEELATRSDLRGCSVDVGLINFDVFNACTKTLLMKKRVEKFENNRNLLRTVLVLQSFDDQFCFIQRE